MPMSLEEVKQDNGLKFLRQKHPISVLTGLCCFLFFPTIVLFAVWDSADVYGQEDAAAEHD